MATARANFGIDERDLGMRDGLLILIQIFHQICSASAEDKLAMAICKIINKQDIKLIMLRCIFLDDIKYKFW